MVPDVTAPLERFHRVLVDEIRRKKPDYLNTSFQLSEIYQRLVPYRSHRDALGLEMNGDYEDVLLRLLAGAGELVILESPEAREQIRRELESKNPNTGLFREFASAEVHLGAASLAAVDAEIHPTSTASRTTEELPALQGSAAGPVQPPTPTGVAADTEETDDTMTTETAETPETTETPEPAGTAGTTQDETPIAATAPAGSTATDTAPKEGTYFDFETTALDSVELQPAAPTTKIATETQDEAPQLVDDDGDGTGKQPVAGIWKPGHPTQETAKEMRLDDCGWCSESLPDRHEVNFCPYCGKTTSLKPCGECGDEMELDWRFCVRCGTEATEPATVAT